MLFFSALLGWTPEVAQLPSLIAGVVAIPLTYWVGRSLFPTPETGLGSGAKQSITEAGGNFAKRWRAKPLACWLQPCWHWTPVAILWAGRARAYTLQQVLVLLAILWLYQRRYAFFTMAFVGAVFAHAEAALLLPGFALGLLLMEGWSVLRRFRGVAGFWHRRASGAGAVFDPPPDLNGGWAVSAYRFPASTPTDAGSPGRPQAIVPLLC